MMDCRKIGELDKRLANKSCPTKKISFFFFFLSGDLRGFETFSYILHIHKIFVLCTHSNLHIHRFIELLVVNFVIKTID